MKLSLWSIPDPDALIFDATVTSTGPRTHLKRRGSNFCVGWWLGDLHSSHMGPIGKKNCTQTEGMIGFVDFSKCFVICRF